VVVNLSFEKPYVEQTGLVEGVRRARIFLMLVEIAGLALVASSCEYVNMQKQKLPERMKRLKPFKRFLPY
jgi:hypothetical protein